MFLTNFVPVQASVYARVEGSSVVIDTENITFTAQKGELHRIRKHAPPVTNSV